MPDSAHYRLVAGLSASCTTPHASPPLSPSPFGLSITHHLSKMPVRRADRWVRDARGKADRNPLPHVHDGSKPREGRKYPPNPLFFRASHEAHAQRRCHGISVFPLPSTAIAMPTQRWSMCFPGMGLAGQLAAGQRRSFPLGLLQHPPSFPPIRYHNMRPPMLG